MHFGEMTYTGREGGVRWLWTGRRALSCPTFQLTTYHRVVGRPPGSAAGDGDALPLASSREPERCAGGGIKLSCHWEAVSDLITA